MEIPSEQPRDAERGRAITEAAQAAAAGDAPGMLAALHTSGFTDGLVRRLGHRFPKLPRDEVDASVAAAADSFYAALRAGRHVVTPAAWLWKAAFNEARDRWCNTFKDLDPSGSEHLDRIPAPDPADRLELEAQAEQRQRAALTAARRLIPQCGEGLVVRAGLGSSQSSLRKKPERPPQESLARPSATALSSSGRSRQLPPDGTIARNRSFAGQNR